MENGLVSVQNAIYRKILADNSNYGTTVRQPVYVKTNSGSVLTAAIGAITMKLYRITITSQVAINRHRSRFRLGQRLVRLMVVISRTGSSAISTCGSTSINI